MGESFTMFLIPRCIQGIASALITVSGNCLRSEYGIKQLTFY